MARISINSPASEISFDCGEVILDSRSTKAIIFTLNQVYNTTEEIVIYPKTLKIDYMGNSIEYSIWNSEDDSYFMDDKNMIISDSLVKNVPFELTLEFSLEGMANEGDIITIDAKDYIKCRDERVITEPILLEIKEIF